jgi:hypothetical protein
MKYAQDAMNLVVIQRATCPWFMLTRMTPTRRRVLQALLYEVFAIAFVGPVLGWAFDKPQGS